uniref:Uncharacterized protein n=1 Tax=Parascaris equorum TaxID=6256 RepID=A0A914RME6_PAREQ
MEAEARRRRRGRRRTTPGPSSVPSPIDDIEVCPGENPLDFNALCSPWNPYGRWLQPHFLKTVSDDDFKDFCKIQRNVDLTKNELKGQLDEWAKKQGGRVYVSNFSALASVTQTT